MNTRLRINHRSLLSLGLVLGLAVVSFPLHAIEGELLISAPFSELIRIEDIASGASASAFATCDPPVTWQQAVGRSTLLGSCDPEDQIPVGFAKINRTYRIFAPDSLNWIYYRATSQSSPDMTAILGNSGFSYPSCTSTCRARTSTTRVSQLEWYEGTAHSIHITLTGGTDPALQGLGSLPTACYIGWFAGGGTSGFPPFGRDIKILGKLVETDPCEITMYHWEDD